MGYAVSQREAMLFGNNDVLKKASRWRNLSNGERRIKQACSIVFFNSVLLK